MSTDEVVANPMKPEEEGKAERGPSTPRGVSGAAERVAAGSNASTAAKEGETTVGDRKKGKDKIEETGTPVHEVAEFDVIR